MQINLFFIYGFTYLVWQYLGEACARLSPGCRTPSCCIVVGGRNCLNSPLATKSSKITLKKSAGLASIVNFYGMAETPGLIFPETVDGYLAVPNFAHVIIRDPTTMEPVTDGTPGLIQILSPSLSRAFAVDRGYRPDRSRHRRKRAVPASLDARPRPSCAGAATFWRWGKRG